MGKISLVFAYIVMLAACSSEPKQQGPNWIRQPSRMVDNGYIVYVGMARGYNPERAQFKAEGIALEDLANECSVIPKGARIEDRYSLVEKDENGHQGQDVAYVKLALEFQECEAAKRAVDPDDVRRVANVPFTEQLKKYQDLSETGEMPGREVAQVEPPDQPLPAPERQPGWDDSTHFYVMRQYVAYQKEVVVLSPPAAYATQSPARQVYMAQVQPAAEQIQTMQARNPAMANQAYSTIPNHPVVARPATLSPPAARMNAVRPPPNYHPNYGNRGRGQNPGGKKSQYRGRRRRQY